LIKKIARVTCALRGNSEKINDAKFNVYGQVTITTGIRYLEFASARQKPMVGNDQHGAT